MGMPPADARLEGDRATGGPGLGEDRRPVLGQECLVGRDHVLARGQRRQHELQRRLRPSHRLDDDVDLGIVDQSRRIGGQSDAVKPDVSRLFQVAHGRPCPADPPARAAGDPVGVIGQQPRDPGSDRPQADHADGDVVHFVISTHA